jgi:hypothetical protein
MKLNPPKKITFWAAVIIAAAGLVVYALHSFVFNKIPFLGGVGFVLVGVAFILICLGLLIKGL